MKRQTITAVTISQCYLGGQHRLASSFLMLRFCHGSPPRVCFVQFEFHFNRPKRLASVPFNPLTGFQFLHAFGMHIHSRHSRLHSRIFFKPSAVLSTDSSLDSSLVDVPIVQNTSLNQHSTRWTNLCPISSTGGCLFSLQISSFPDLRLLTCCPLVTCSETNL